MRTKHKDNQLPGRVNIPKSTRPVREIPDVNILKVYIGIDNGVSGSIGATNGNHHRFSQMPVFSDLNYTKEKKNVTRINHRTLLHMLQEIVLHAAASGPPSILAILERPMVNPGRFQATASALRALEATLVVIETLQIPYMFIDSKEWQKDMLPKGIKGTDALKAASKQVGARLFPQFTDKYKGDADGILIAEWARRKQL